jgi:hypothetical protein
MFSAPGASSASNPSSIREQSTNSREYRPYRLIQIAFWGAAKTGLASQKQWFCPLETLHYFGRIGNYSAAP